MRRAALATALLALLLAPHARGVEPLPARQRALLLLRVLVYDRNLATRVPGEMMVAVVFRPGHVGSEAERDAMLAAFEAVAGDVVAAGRPVRAVAVPWRGAADLEARLARIRPAAAYVGASLAREAPDVAAATRRRDVLSVTGSREAVEGGVAVGLVNLGTRAGLVVNPEAARAEGADLDAALLALAEVVPGRR